MKKAFRPTRRELLRAVGTGGIAALTAATSRAAEPAPAKTHLPHARPEDIGIDPRRLRVACDLLEKWTTGPEAPVPGGAILVGRSGKVVPPRFFGRQGPERDAGPIRRDALFLMASITKPITYLGAL